MAEIVVEPIENFGLSQKNRPKTLFSKVGAILLRMWLKCLSVQGKNGRLAQ